MVDEQALSNRKVVLRLGTLAGSFALLTGPLDVNGEKGLQPNFHLTIVLGDTTILTGEGESEP